MLSRVFSMFDGLESIITHATSLNFDTRKNAIDQISILAKEGEIPSEKLDEVFNLLISRADDEESVIKISSLSGIKFFIERDKLCLGKIGQALDLSMEKIMDLNDAVKNNALLVIIELIKQNKLFAEKIEAVLDILIINSQNIDRNIAESAIFGINKLIVNNKLPVDKLKTVWSIFIVSANSEDAALKKETLFGIGELIERSELPLGKTNEILSLLMTEVKSAYSMVRKEALFGINCLIIKNALPTDIIEAVFELLVVGTKYRDDKSRTEALYGIAKLIEKNKLSTDQVEKSIDIFIAGERDKTTKQNSLLGIDIIIGRDRLPITKMELVLNLLIIEAQYGSVVGKKNALFGIKKIIEKNQLPEVRVEEVLDILIAEVKNTDIAIRNNVFFGITRFIERGILPEGKTEIVLDLLILGVKSTDPVIRKNALFGIGELVDKDKVAEEKIEEVLKVFIAEAHETNVGIRKEILFGISKLVENNKLSVAKLKEILSQFVVEEKDAEIRLSVISGLVKLIEKNNLSIDKTHEILELLVERARDSSSIIRKEAILGIIKLIDQNRLPKDKIERVLDFLEERAKIESDKHTKHKAIVAIKKIADQNLISEHKIEIILNLLISIKKSNTLLFKGIREAEKEEITEILNGATIAKIKAAHPSITYLISETESLTNEAKAAAVLQLTAFIRKEKVPADRIVEVLAFLAVKAKDLYDDIRNNALLGINELIDKGILSIDTIEEILSLYLKEARNTNNDTRKYALLGINKLVEKSQFPAKKIEKMIDVLIARVKDTDIDIKKHALFGINKLIEKNKLTKKVEKFLDILVVRAKDTEIDIRQKAIFGISRLIEKSNMPLEKSEETLCLLIIMAKDIDSEIRSSALYGIRWLIEKNDLPEDKIEEIVGLLVSGINDKDKNIRSSALSWLSQLIINNNLLTEKIGKALDFLIEGELLEDGGSYINKLKELIDLAVKSRIEDSQDQITEMLSSSSHAEEKPTIKLVDQILEQQHKTDQPSMDIADFTQETLVEEDSNAEWNIVSDKNSRDRNFSKKKKAIALLPKDSSKAIASSSKKPIAKLTNKVVKSGLAKKEVSHIVKDTLERLALDETTLVMSQSIGEYTQEAIAPLQTMMLKKDDISDLESLDAIGIASSKPMHTSLEVIATTPLAEEIEIKFGGFDSTSIITSSELQAHEKAANPSTTSARKKHYYKPYNKSPYVLKNALIQEIQQLYANQYAMAGEIQRLNDVLQNTAQQTYFHQHIDVSNAAYQQTYFHQDFGASNAVYQNPVQEIIQLQDYRGKIYYCIKEQYLDTGLLRQFFIDPETGGQVFPISYSLHRKENIGELSENSGSVIQGTIEIDETIDRVNARFDDISIQSEYRSESFTVSQTLQLSMSSDSVILSVIDSSVLKSEFWRLSVLCNKNVAFVFLESKSEYRAIISTIHHDLSESKDIASSSASKDLAAEFIEEHYFSNVDVGVVQGTKRLSNGKISYEEKNNDDENALLISDGKSYQRTKIMFQSLGEALHSKLHLDQRFNAYVNDNDEVFHYVLVDISYEETNKLQQEWDTKISERLVEDSKSEAPTVSQMLPITVPTNLADLSQEIASAVLVKIKKLLKTGSLMVETNESEVELGSELAKKLVTTNCILLELLEKNPALKLLFIEQLAAELNQSSQLYIEHGKFYIQEELKQNIGGFIGSIIAQAKAGLKQHEYRDSSGSIVEIRYVNNIHYDSDNLILRREELLYEAGQIGGIKAINNLIELGEDPEIAITLIKAARQYGIKHVLNIILSGQYTENANLLKIEANTDMSLLTYEQNSAVLRLQFDPLAIIDSLSEDEIHQTQIASSLKYFITQFLDRLNVDISWQYKKFIYHQDLKHLREILHNNNIDRSIDVLRDYSDFRKLVLFKIHPDKGGNNDDFVFVKALQEKFSANLDLDIKTLLDDKVQTISSMVYKASIGFKMLDAMVDTIRLVYEPTIDHTKKLTLDSAYIYSIYSGVNGYSLGISTADILYQTYQGEYLQALKQAATSMSYMVLPSIIGYLGVPYLGFTYGAGVMVYTGYSSITNAYSLYQEYGSVEFLLRSATAYKNFIQVLANSPLQKIYDFVGVDKGYAVKINNINLNLNLNLEKAAIKAQLDAKREFGHKLYDYIYAPSLEEKYDLLNKVIRGSLTKEQAESLKAEHTKIISENQVYEYCMEIKDIEKNIDCDYNADIKHYYCYNQEQQELDYVIIGESRGYVEVVERL